MYVSIYVIFLQCIYLHSVHVFECGSNWQMSINKKIMKQQLLKDSTEEVKYSEQVEW